MKQNLEFCNIHLSTSPSIRLTLRVVVFVIKRKEVIVYSLLLVTLSVYEPSPSHSRKHEGIG